MTEELIGIIGGSGLGDALAERITDAELHDIDTPGGSCFILVKKDGSFSTYTVHNGFPPFQYSPWAYLIFPQLYL